MKFLLPVPPQNRGRAAGNAEHRRKTNAWIAAAGWRLQVQLAARVRRRRPKTLAGPITIAMAVPGESLCAFAEQATPILELLCRHGVIAAIPESTVRGISIVPGNLDEVEVALETAPLSGIVR